MSPHLSPSPSPGSLCPEDRRSRAAHLSLIFLPLASLLLDCAQHLCWTLDSPCVAPSSVLGSGYLWGSGLLLHLPIGCSEDVPTACPRPSLDTARAGKPCQLPDHPGSSQNPSASVHGFPPPHGTSAPAYSSQMICSPWARRISLACPSPLHRPPTPLALAHCIPCTDSLVLCVGHRGSLATCLVGLADISQHAVVDAIIQACLLLCF